MSKPIKKTNTEKYKLIIAGESSNVDKCALVCDLIMMGVFISNQILFEMNMLFIIIPLFLLGIYLFLFCVVPEKYCFTEMALEIKHKYRRTVSIEYGTVFNYDSSVRDSFINISQSNKVKVYYMESNKKRMILCRPTDVDTFVETLKKCCPEFQDESGEKSKLEVFFNKK